MITVPDKIKRGDEIRIIAPARSLSILSEENIEGAKNRLENEGYKVTFSKHCKEKDLFMSSSIKSRVEDIHDAFRDDNVKALFSVIGGFNSNQILESLDYELIGSHPKILCGFSDITALANAITAKTGMITYSGPHFSTWAMEKEFEYNLEYFNKCLTGDEEFSVEPSASWTDDLWFLDQNNREIEPNEGFQVINEGRAEGRIFGGNLCTFNLLQGTGYMPDLSDSILFLEDDDLAGDYSGAEFDRNLQSLIHQPQFHKVRGIVIGRFQKKSGMTMEKLRQIIQTKEVLKRIPILVDADFGHTNPLITFPIGGRAGMNLKNDGASLSITLH